MNSQSDIELVNLYSSSKETRFLSELFARHSDISYRTALRIMKNSADSEDVLQTAYCKMIRDIHLYKGTGTVLGWMLQVIIHTCYQYKNSEKSRTKREKIIMTERSNMQELRNNDLSEMIEVHLNKLPEIYKIPITLQMMEGLSIREVSQALEIPEKTIRSQIARGLEKLRVSLQSVGFTVTVISLSASLKNIKMPLAPESIKTKSYFESLFSNNSRSSLYVKSSSNILIFKIVLITFLLSLTAGIYVYLKKENSAIIKENHSFQFWNFENVNKLDQYKSIALVSGAITIINSLGINQSNALLVDDETILAIDISDYSLPIRISYETDVLMSSAGQGQIFIKNNYVKGKNIYHLSDLREKIPMPISGQNSNSKYGFMGKWYSHACYIDKDCVDFSVSGKRSHLLMGQSENTQKIYFYVKGQTLIDNFKIESIDQKEMPDKTNCENVIASISFKDGVKNYKLDKKRFNIPLENEASPKLTLIQPDYFESILYMNSDHLKPRIDENQKVAWTKPRQKVFKNWSFNNLEDTRGIVLKNGEMRIVEMKGVNKSNVLYVAEESVLEIDISEFQLPIRITQIFDNLLPPGAEGKGILICKKNYDVQKNIFNFTKLSEIISVDISENAKNENAKFGYFGNFYKRVSYVSDECTQSWINGSRGGVLWGTSYDNSKIFIYVKDKTIFDSIEIESIELKEVPDTEDFKKYIEKIPFVSGAKNIDIEKEKKSLGVKSNLHPQLFVYDAFSIEHSLNSVSNK